MANIAALKLYLLLLVSALFVFHRQTSHRRIDVSTLGHPVMLTSVQILSDVLDLTE